jgi:hypothetical protein
LVLSYFTKGHSLKEILFLAGRENFCFFEHLEADPSKTGFFSELNFNFIKMHSNNGAINCRVF